MVRSLQIHMRITITFLILVEHIFICTDVHSICRDHTTFLVLSVLQGSYFNGKALSKSKTLKKRRENTYRMCISHYKLLTFLFLVAFAYTYALF